MIRTNGKKMKTSKILIPVLLILAAAAVGIFFFHSKPGTGRVLRANLTEAQKMLATLRRAQMAYQKPLQGYNAVFAKNSGGKMLYSDGWNAMKLPSVEASAGFDFECLPTEHVCRALEPGKTGQAASGIQIDLGTGIFSCLGIYKPVTTEGYDSVPVVVACQAS